MTRVAAIDCGTNSIRLLVADVDVEAGTLTDVVRRMEVVRLGQGVDRTGRIAPEAMERTLDACRRYAAEARELGAGPVRFVATSASRDAENRQQFDDGVVGRDVEVAHPQRTHRDAHRHEHHRGRHHVRGGRRGLEFTFGAFHLIT